jgi:hypothetical protein
VKLAVVSFTTSPARRAAVLAGAAALALTAMPATAEASSILYRKGGRLFVTSPVGKHKHAIPHSKGLANPSQDDHGNVVGQRGVKLYRLNRRGRKLNKPFTTPFRTSPLLPAFNGPFFPQVSPNGKTIAYTYAFTESHYDPGCDCTSTAPSFNVTYTKASRATEDPARTFGLARMYSKASWIDNRRAMMTTEHLYNFAGDGLNTIAIDTLGGAADSYDSWFSECVNCTDPQTIQLYPLDDGEMTRQHDKLVFVSGPLGTRDVGSTLLMYALAPGQPPGIPQHFCTTGGANGKFGSPSWSPDGRSLAWADSRGVWVGRVGSLAGEECQVLNRRLIAAGASSPDWGPAKP